MGEQNEEIKSGFASKWRDSGSGDAQKTENTTDWGNTGEAMDAVGNEQDAPETEQAAAGAEQEENGEQEKSMAETIEKVKKFLLDNKDILILSGQLALVALVCVVGIKNDLTPEQCCKKKHKKKR